MAAEGIMVAVGAVIKDENERVLLVKHRPERGGFWQGKWICPGGKLMLGERIEEGIKREVKEETNLEINLTAPLTTFDRIVESEGGTELHVIYINYLAEKAEGELRPNSDVGEARWASRKDILDIWEELHEDTRKLFRIAEIVQVGE
ncbi:MAG TPA: NUDIX domain-containing protein [Dehalococcoidia bacterium]|nr:NUDIX domain-containing protein [Dehalococcoidia bacterium]